MTLFLILMIGGAVGLLMGALLRRLGMVRRLLDVALGVGGAFVAGAMGSSALLEGLTATAAIASALAAGALVAAAHLASAMLRPVHAKYFGR